MLPESAIKEFIEIYRKQNFYLFFKSISNEISNINKNINIIKKGGKEI